MTLDVFKHYPQITSGLIHSQITSDDVGIIMSHIDSDETTIEYFLELSLQEIIDQSLNLSSEYVSDLIGVINLTINTSIIAKSSMSKSPIHLGEKITSTKMRTLYTSIGELGNIILMLMQVHSDSSIIKETKKGLVINSFRDLHLFPSLPLVVKEFAVVEKLVINRLSKGVETRMKMICNLCVNLVALIPLQNLADQKKIAKYSNYKLQDFFQNDRSELLELLLIFNDTKSEILKKIIPLLLWINKMESLILKTATLKLGEEPTVSSISNEFRELLDGQIKKEGYTEDIILSKEVELKYTPNSNPYRKACAELDTVFNFDQFTIYYALITDTEIESGKEAFHKIVQKQIKKHFSCEILKTDIDRFIKSHLWEKLLELEQDKRTTIGKFLIENKTICLNQNNAEFVEYILNECNEETLVQIEVYLSEGFFKKNTSLNDILVSIGEIQKENIVLPLVQEKTSQSINKVLVTDPQKTESNKDKFDEYALLLQKETIWEQFILDDPVKNKEIFDLHNVLPDDDREYIQENFTNLEEINIVQLRRFYNFLATIHGCIITLDELNFKEVDKNITVEKIDLLYTLFKEYNQNKNVVRVKRKIEVFIQEGDVEKIGNFMKPDLLNMDDFPHYLDRSIVEMLNEGDNIVIERISSLLEEQITELFTQLNPGFYSSTGSNNGLGTGSYTRSIRSIFAKLKKNHDEDSSDYLKRVIISDISQIYSNVDNIPKRLIGILSHLEKSKGLFQILSTFSKTVIMQIGVNEIEDITGLSKGFSEISNVMLTKIANEIEQMQINY